MQRLLKCIGDEKDNLTRIDRETKMDKGIPKLRFYYIILALCV
jgi:hypothetical protein